jgi:hypothetical protein
LLALASILCRMPLIIRLIIQTIRLDPSGAIWTDEAPNVSSLDRSGADQIDVEHQATDLAVRHPPVQLTTFRRRLGSLLADQGRGRLMAGSTGKPGRAPRDQRPTTSMGRTQLDSPPARDGVDHEADGRDCHGGEVRP